MKKKELTKKLKLNKETISRLDNSDTGKVFGGRTVESLCPTYCGDTCGGPSSPIETCP